MIAVIIDSFFIFLDCLNTTLFNQIPTWFWSQIRDYSRFLRDFRVSNSLFISYFYFRLLYVNFYFAYWTLILLISASSRFFCLVFYNLISLYSLSFYFSDIIDEYSDDFGNVSVSHTLHILQFFFLFLQTLFKVLIYFIHGTNFMSILVFNLLTHQSLLPGRTIDSRHTNWLWIDAATDCLLGILSKFIFWLLCSHQ